MRIALVGRPAQRNRLRFELTELGVEIAAEFETAAQMRAADVDADAVVIAPSRSNFDRDTDEPADTDSDALQEPLTARELEVLELLAEGLPNKSIAERLGISDQTVKFHVAAIIGKLGARNRTDAVRRALRRGLVTI